MLKQQCDRCGRDIQANEMPVLLTMTRTSSPAGLFTDGRTYHFSICRDCSRVFFGWIGNGAGKEKR